MKRLFATTSLAAILFSAVVYAYEESEPPAEAPPAPDAEFVVEEVEAESNLDDPAFSSLVNFPLLGEAIASGDAASATDVALQLAHAEKVLYRNHRTLTSADLLQTAARIAQNNGDKETLKRIATAAKNLNLPEISQQVQATLALGGASRAIDPPPQLSLNIDPDVFAAVRQLLDTLEAAENAGDRQSLTGLLVDLKTLDLQPELSAWIEKRIQTGLDSIPEGAAQQSELLGKLAGASRGLPNIGSFTPPRTGIPIRSPFVLRKNEFEPNILPASPQSRPQPKPQNRMYQNGYRHFNDVQMNQQGQLRIGNQQIQARRGYNPQTGRGAWVYQTPQGGTIIRRDNDSRTYVKPGPQYGRPPQRQQYPSGGKPLGTFDLNSYRMQRLGY